MNKHCIINHVPADLVSIISFSDNASVILPLTEVMDPRALSEPTRLRAGGMTNLTAGLQFAMKLLTPLPRHIIRRAVVIGDGEPNRETETLLLIAGEMRNAYITIDSVYCGGNGEGADTLRRVSQTTVGGRSYVAADVKALKQLVTQGAARLHARQAATVFVVDCSGSMSTEMAGPLTRLDAAVRSLQDFVLIKRHAYSEVTNASGPRPLYGRAYA